MSLKNLSKLRKILFPKSLSLNVIDRSIFINMRKLSTTSNAVEEKKVHVNGVDINYVKTGLGAHPVLLLPGALGSGWTDFKPQIEKLDKTKLTVVAWDPPGYGKSRPPDRIFSKDFFERDAQYAHDLMKVLGFSKFSLIGWSDGGITSLILTAKNPESVDKLVISGTNAYILPQEIKIYEGIRNIDSWSERMRAPLLALYGRDYFQKMLNAWVDTMSNIYQTKNGDLCKDSVTQIKCPTLIMHGRKDVMVDPEHPVFLKKNIPNSKLEYFNNGSHNFHLKYHEEFNKMVTDFIINNN
ncbi:valacyclovir hydrolase [Chelonus insularis]|uniref:valacyclovir hydrolase n=1 Tax=Chelonus insularis TaxID=460826 RepID=UPI00158EB882|nr:valacyclovir hydrolase [Chelonus insularis]